MSKGGFGGLPTLTVVVCAGGMHSTLLLLLSPYLPPISSELVVGLFVSCQEFAPTGHANLLKISIFSPL